MKNVLQRIKQYIDFKKLTIRTFEKTTGMSNGSFSSQLKNNKTIGVDKLENILRTYPEINPQWLLTGKGNMINSLFPNEKNTPKATTLVQERESEPIIMSDDEKLSTLIKANQTLSEASFILAQTTQDAVRLATDTIAYDRQQTNSNRMIMEKLVLFLDTAKKKTTGIAIAKTTS